MMTPSTQGRMSPEKVVVASTSFEVVVGFGENPFGTQSMNVAFTTACSQCHSQIHGTDLPSQALSSGGRGLVR